MNLFQPISIAAACFLVLSACASAPPSPRASASAAKAPPPAASDGLAQPAAAQDSAYGGANTGGTDPYGAIQAGGQQAGQQTNQGLTTSATRWRQFIDFSVDNERAKFLLSLYHTLGNAIAFSTNG